MTVSSLTEARWQRTNSTDDFSPLEALHVAIAQIERGDVKADHCVICFGATGENGASTTDWFQAGKYGPHAQLGLIERVKIEIILNAEKVDG